MLTRELGFKSCSYGHREGTDEGGRKNFVVVLDGDDQIPGQVGGEVEGVRKDSVISFGLIWRPQVFTLHASLDLPQSRAYAESHSRHHAGRSA